MSRHQDKQEERIFDEDQLPSEFKIARSKIMYIEDKTSGLEGDARIGRVYFSKSGKTLYYRGLKFQSLKGSGFKANYFEVESNDHYWISGPRKDQNNRLYGGNRGVQIDSDIHEEYLQEIKPYKFAKFAALPSVTARDAFSTRPLQRRYTEES